MARKPESTIDLALPFVIEEYRERLAGVRERMRESSIDLLLVTGPENIYYLSGYQTTGYYIYQAGFDDRGFFLPPHILDGLWARLQSAHFVPAGDLVERGRMIKSSQELDYIREATSSSISSPATRGRSSPAWSFIPSPTAWCRDWERSVSARPSPSPRMESKCCPIRRGSCG